MRTCLTLILLLGACSSTDEGGPGELAELEGALPEADLLRVSAPGDTLSGDGERQGALVGKTSGMYEFTRKTAIAVNVGLAGILGPIQFVVKNLPPTLKQRGRAVWMGSTPLDPQYHLLVVEKKDDGHFEYALLARLKAPADSPWRYVIVGTYTPDGTPRQGQGAVWIDLDQTLDPEEKGKVLALWSRAGGTKTISVFRFRGDAAAKGDDRFFFQQADDGEGVFVYTAHQIDVDEGEPGKEALEDAVAISRWKPSGAGRGDFVATGGDVERQKLESAWMTQCWEATGFTTTFEQVTAVPAKGPPFVVASNGDPATCTYSEPGEPVLPEASEPSPPGDQPVEVR